MIAAYCVPRCVLHPKVAESLSTGSLTVSKRTLEMPPLFLPVMTAGGEAGEGRSEHELVFPDFQALLSWVPVPSTFSLQVKVTRSDTSAWSLVP